jgi:SagB-type dehydrogenase family enzyme
MDLDVKPKRLQSDLWGLSHDADVRMSKSNPGTFEISSGHGSNRASLYIDNKVLLSAILKLCKPRSLREIGILILPAVAKNHRTTNRIILELIRCRIIESTDKAVDPVQLHWEINGWRDALQFHKATTDLVFNRDSSAYESQMIRRKAMAEIGCDYPNSPTSKYYPNAQRIVLPLNANKRARTIESVFSQSRPFRSFSGDETTLEAFSSLFAHAYKSTIPLNGLLGHYFKRSSPSGGGRQPLEAYVVVNNVNGIEQGLYHYLPLEHSLEFLKSGDFRDRASEACFQKPGIITANFVVVLTVRWNRHMWKYRYARSYRMVLLEVGHLIQTQQLVSTALGLQSFLCPSINDGMINGMLALDEEPDAGNDWLTIRRAFFIQSTLHKAQCNYSN